MRHLKLTGPVRPAWASLRRSCLTPETVRHGRDNLDFPGTLPASGRQRHVGAGRKGVLAEQPGLGFFAGWETFAKRFLEKDRSRPAAARATTLRTRQNAHPMRAPSPSMPVGWAESGATTQRQLKFHRDFYNWPKMRELSLFLVPVIVCLRPRKSWGLLFAPLC